MTTAWQERLKQLYGAGIAHAFVLHFNVKDHVQEPGMSLERYLSHLFTKMRLIVFYNPATGFSFPLESMNRDVSAMPGELRDILGLNAAPQANANPTVARLQQQAAQAAELPKAPAQAIPLIDKLLRTKIGPNDFGLENVAVVITNAEAAIPHAEMSTILLNQETRTNHLLVGGWGNDFHIADTGNIVVMVTESMGDLGTAVRTASSKWEHIAIELPDNETRLHFTQAIVRDGRAEGIEWEISPEQFAAAAAGLSLVGMEDVILHARYMKKMTRALVMERKSALTAAEFSEVIQINDPQFGWEAIGGLQIVKDFFTKRIINLIAKGDYERVPMGVLMVGSPGTGKSVVAQAVAKESGINSVTLNLAKIYNKYVGDTERNLERALQAIRSLSPCIVFMDEVDQTVSRSNSGDAGVSSRVFGRLLEFMADTSHRGQIVFLAATNRPDLIDPALMRPGRVDAVLGFFSPEDEERVAIFRIKAAESKLAVTDIPAQAIRNTAGWTGAYIGNVTNKATYIVEDEGLDPALALVEATQRICPPPAQDSHYYDMLALAHINDIDLVPARMRPYMANGKATVQQEIAEHKDRFERGPRSL